MIGIANKKLMVVNTRPISFVVFFPKKKQKEYVWQFVIFISWAIEEWNKYTFLFARSLVYYVCTHKSFEYLPRGNLFWYQLHNYCFFLNFYRFFSFRWTHSIAMKKQHFIAFKNTIQTARINHLNIIILTIQTPTIQIRDELNINYNLSIFWEALRSP